MIIIMSDSHGESEAIANIKTKYQHDASLIIHCGDSEFPATDPIWQGVSVVRGNCDFDNGFPESTVLTADGISIFATHGHLYNVGFTLSHLAETATENHCQVATFGHLHTPIVHVEEGVLCINPGSVAQPRGQYQTKMYAKLEVTPDTYVITYLDLAHQPIDGLAFEVPRVNK